MINKLFKKTSPEDVLAELKQKTFKEDKVSSMLNEIDINVKFSDGQNFLHKVVPHNNIESVKSLIKHGININEQNLDGNTALHLAAQHSFYDTLVALIEAKADHSIENEHGRTALQEAIKTGLYKNYALLSSLSFDPNHIDKDGMTLLDEALKSENSEILDDLVNIKKVKIECESLFNPNFYENLEVFKKILNMFNDKNILNKNGQNLLFAVASGGEDLLPQLEYLIQNGVDINHKDNNNDSVLTHVIKTLTSLQPTKEDELKNVDDLKAKVKNLLNIIPHLIENEIDPSICNNDDENALTLAVKSLNKDLLLRILDYDVNPNIQTTNKNNALSIAALVGNEAIEIVYLLLDYGASPNFKDSDGKTVIEKLIDIELFKKSGKKLPISQRKQIDENSDYLAILDVILANGESHLFDINSSHEPYFFETVKYGNMHLTKLLVKYGADINQRDGDGLNIIYRFMAENKSFRREIDLKNYYTNLKALIGMGANVNAKDSYGGITLHKAILDCDVNTVKIILHSGADINAVDSRGRNMIHNCMWQNKIKTFRLIYTFNKKLLNEPDKFGVLPINYAAFLGYKDMVLELVRTGSHINNPYKKTPYIINFLKRFHQNIKELEEKAINKSEKNIIKTLVDNMRKEFEIE